VRRPIVHTRPAGIGAGLDQRRLVSGGILPVVLAVVTVNHGGFSPIAWGWSSLALLSLCVFALLLSRESSIRARELAFLGSLAAFLGWTLVSATWSSSPTQPVLEAERLVVYIAACLSAFLLIRSYRAFLLGIWTAVSLVCTYSLSTRLFPTRLGVFDSIAGYRLSEPIGYWNGLGLFAAMGLLLALGLVLRMSHPLIRFAAGSSIVLLAATLYFTFSRGAWISLTAGFLALLILERRRLEVLAALLAIGPWAAAGIWFASQSTALTRLRATLDAAAADGLRVALVLVGLAVAAGVAVAILASLEKRLQVPRAVRIASCGLALLAAVAVLVTVSVREGSPQTLARRAYAAFTSPSPPKGNDLNQRLFRLSAGLRIPQWHVAWREYRTHPWLGTGAGTYGEYWLRYRPSRGTVKDAHNLYLETLAELGPIGLAALLLALVLPLASAVQARKRGLVPAACAAYAAYLVDAAGEWDWELPAITLTALFVACAVVVAARSSSETRVRQVPVRMAASVAALALGLFAFVGLVGNSALQASANATQVLQLDRAEAQARKATRWMPWSSAPWQQLGEAQLYRGEKAAARHSLRRAVAKDPQNWELWYTLALVSSGEGQQRALKVAAELNPLDADVRALASELSDATRRSTGGQR
jgi:hypothetical protein